VEDVGSHAAYMLDGVSLDQLRTFIAAADEGSFSAAGRRLKRAQSVVSQTLANLEGQIGVNLFDRRGRFPVLTGQGRALLTEARAAVGGVELFKSRAKSLAGGLEPELNVVVDIMFPVVALISGVTAFQEKFPSTVLRLQISAWSGVVEPVLDGRCSVGIVGSYTLAPPLLDCERLMPVSIVAVASPRHPLASHIGPIPTATLAEHIQLVHTDPSNSSRICEFGPVSPRAWFISHLADKQAFLRAGLGFGSLPLPMVEADLASGALVRIKLEDTPPDGHVVVMSAAYRKDIRPGPAVRWFIDHLKQEETRRLNTNTLRSAASIPAIPERRPMWSRPPIEKQQSP
jgi:DNA-binding transcriptional LysR family regulator